MIRTEIIKLLEAGIIYPIADSRWVSHVHCVPNNRGFSIVPIEMNELIPHSFLSDFRLVIDY